VPFEAGLSGWLPARETHHAPGAPGSSIKRPKIRLQSFTIRRPGQSQRFVRQRGRLSIKSPFPRPPHNRRGLTEESRYGGTAQYAVSVRCRPGVGRTIALRSSVGTPRNVPGARRIRQNPYRPKSFQALGQVVRTQNQYRSFRILVDGLNVARSTQIVPSCERLPKSDKRGCPEVYIV
jgi:hypothetical protein